MVRLELDQVVMRRMKEDDIEMVKALIKVGARFRWSHHGGNPSLWCSC